MNEFNFLFDLDGTLVNTDFIYIEVWKELDELRDEHNIKWNWVKGHSGDPGNETADMLANRGIDEL